MAMPSQDRAKPAATPLRTGAEYLRSLNDGRAVFVEGERVKDVSEAQGIPRGRAFGRAALRHRGRAGKPRADDLHLAQDRRAGASRAYQIPQSHADLRAAPAVLGEMGGSDLRPDGPHARPRRGLLLPAMPSVPEVFAKGGQKYADNVVAFYEKMRDEHLYVSYAIVPPQIDRSKPAHKQSDPALYAGVVKERDDGIVISGAQQLATGGVLSDWLHLSCIHPLQPGDENYANCLAVPINAPGLKLYPRRPFALRADNAFDYPLSSRFDETDNYVVFDNVFVPWEHVFIYRNIEVSRDQWWKTTAHTLGNHQAQVRYVTKLRFMIGLAQRMNEMTGNVAAPPVQVMMGELAALVSIYEGMLLAQEIVAPIKDGVLWPSPVTLYSAMAMQSEFNGRMLEMIRELAGGAFITLPSSLADLESPRRAPDMERYQRSASTDARSTDRADAASVGLPRLGVRQPPSAVRKVLWRRVVPREARTSTGTSISSAPAPWWTRRWRFHHWNRRTERTGPAHCSRRRSCQVLPFIPPPN